MPATHTLTRVLLRESWIHVYQQGLARSENKYTQDNPICIVSVCVCVCTVKAWQMPSQPLEEISLRKRVGVEKGGDLLFPSVLFG